MKDARASVPPWQGVEVNGDFDRCEREWLLTNGAGAYAMSTVALMHTRREHGLLVASLEPPNERLVVLSHAETSVNVGSRRHRLSTHRFPGVAPTPGYRSLVRYDQDPLPRWTYRLGKHTLERTLALVPGRNVVVIRFAWFGKGEVQLCLMPLLSMRPISGLLHEHGAMVQRVTLRPGAVEVQPVRNLPPVQFRHDGVFMGSPDWWRRFEYSEDQAQHREHEEDLWTPGTFELGVSADKPCYLVAALGEAPRESAPQLLAQAEEALRQLDPGPEFAPLVRRSRVSARSFVVRSDRDEAFVVAGYPDLSAASRDQLVTIAGFTQFDRDLPTARDLLRTCLRRVRGGLLPLNLRVTDRTHPCPDASLWLFEAARQYVERADVQSEFVVRELFPRLRRVYLRLRRTSAPWVWTTTEGLMATGAADGFPLTWMDAFHSGHAVTARAGVAVEHQALWIRGTSFLSELARALGQHRLAERASETSARALAAFRERFWCNETEYPFDCISPAGDTADAWADPTVRPNALIALSIAPECFEEWQARAILSRVRQELLAPTGVRTLSPADAHYQSVCEGDGAARAAALHQGTAWPHLLGVYVRCAARYDTASTGELRKLLEGAAERSPALGYLNQLSDGEAPHHPRGCPAQAWSLTELLRAALAIPVGEDSG
ncbi:MAG: amylo-alpha-1,6-glucosidase [Polyangiaceae bacterium]